MEHFLSILSGVAIGFLGMVFFTLFKSRKHFATWRPLKTPLKVEKKEEWSIRTLIDDNAGRWFWTMVMVVVIAVAVEFVPEVATGISSVTALDISGNLAGFFTAGAGLYASTHKKTHDS